MFNFRTYVSTVLGLMAMLSSGLSIGTDGPYVRIAGCIAESVPYKGLKESKIVHH